jgi:NAD(P)-dependent dehydrogenase (short-subunit alcohol dehydrogenase family)
MSDQSNRKVLITGGASGFGIDIGRALSEQGASVILLDNNEGALERARHEVPNCDTVRADVTRPEAVNKAVAFAVDRLGGLDTLVISAGVIHIKPLEKVTESDWDLVMDVNVKGAFLVIQAAAAALRESGRGRIVAISSDVGHRGAPYLQAYTASKFALIGLIESVAVELAPDHVTANCVCPVGCPTTGMGQQVLDWKTSASGSSSEEVLAAAARQSPLGRNAAVDDITSAVLFFVSDASSFLTGVSLDVDGGLRLGNLPGVKV